MKFHLLPLIFSFVVLACGNNPSPVISEKQQAQFMNGDIIFQTSTSSQSQAIQLATNSVYSHVGILYHKNDNWFVLEAIQPVSITPLQQWINRGKEGVYVVKRLQRDNGLSEQELESMETYADGLVGKPYDLLFEWSDDKIYCSELVWKIYKEGLYIELCPLKQFKDYDYSDAAVQAKIKERFGNNFPREEWVVSPDDIFQSVLLEVVE